METITISNLSKSFGARTVFSGLNTNIGKGRVVALLGRNGAGKSTLLSILNGQQQPTTGSSATLGIDPVLLKAALEKYETAYGIAINRVYSEKFGLYQWQDAEGDVMDAAFALLMESEIDMTIFFRALATAESTEALQNAFYLDGQWQLAREKWTAWFARYAALVAEQNPTFEQQTARVSRMNTANPKYVLRNYLAQQAIDAAHAGDYSKIAELLDVMRKPYDDQPGREIYAEKRPDWARTKAGCSMLSCSS